MTYDDPMRFFGSSFPCKPTNIYRVQSLAVRYVLEGVFPCWTPTLHVIFIFLVIITMFFFIEVFRCIPLVLNNNFTDLYAYYVICNSLILLYPLSIK